MSSYHTTDTPSRSSQSSPQSLEPRSDDRPRPPYPRHARITGWMIRHLTNGERLVAEGLRIELRDGESRITTSAEIAQWANVSESTVSRAMSGLIAKQVITARRVTYAETGRDRWEITLLPIWVDANDSTDAAPTRAGGSEGSVMDAGSLMPQEGCVASQCVFPAVNDTSMTDPSNILDSYTHMQQQAAPAAHGSPSACSPVADNSARMDADPDTLNTALSQPVVRPSAESTEPYRPGTTTSPPGTLGEVAFSAALAKIQRMAPDYSDVCFAADLDKAMTRFREDERDRAVALVIWCAMRQEPVYSREDLQARVRLACPPSGSDNVGSQAPAARPIRLVRPSAPAHGSWDHQGVGVVLPEALQRAYEERLRADAPGATPQAGADSGMDHGGDGVFGSMSLAATPPSHQQHPPVPACGAWNNQGVGTVLPESLLQRYERDLRAQDQAAAREDLGSQGGTA